MSSLYQLHVDSWKDCKRCELYLNRERVVEARGSVPAEVVFVGEAPGVSEDSVGRPFVGPAGHLLNKIIDRALGAFDTSGEPHYRMSYACYNLVGCIPLNEEGTAKVSEPEDKSIIACSPRLQQFIRICDPKLLVCVGKLSKTWLTPGFKHSIKFHKAIRMVDIVHPAAILRQSIAVQGLAVDRCVITVQSAVEEILSEQLTKGS